MLSVLRSIAVAAVVAFSGAMTAQAATIVDPTLYEDLAVDTTNDLDGFTVNPAAGPASLSIRYGQWNGTPAVMELIFTFNGTALAPVAISSGAYYSDPTSISYDVTSLIAKGLNTLSVYAYYVSGGPVTYAVGEVTLDYVEASAVPVPASLPLLFAGMGLIAVVGRRRRSA